MAATLFRRLARAAVPTAASPGGGSGGGGGGYSRSMFSRFGFPLGAIAAVSGISYIGSGDASPSLTLHGLVHLEEAKEEDGPKVALDPKKWTEFKLQDTATVSHNTHLYRFTFDPSKELGLHVASCLLTRYPETSADGKTKYVIRPYTPISDPAVKGHFDLLIKFQKLLQTYPDGKMSQYLASLKPGDVIEVKGPIGKIRYSPNMKKHIGMIAGGTGITPMLQVIEEILKNPDDNTQVSLLYANVSPDDILLKQKLDYLATHHPNLKIFYTVDNPTKSWKGGVGYVSKDMALKGLPAPGDDTIILVCGPPGMMKQISGEKAKAEQGELSGILKELGYTEEMVYKF
ncbi:unnamed protein product [Linum tenue]|uniref:NADH-cytochrome b5 reductase n=1 Tax=Linum tenue TaxID=586396 RepID=A0AAV0QD82_9ROSI|nr:unnamed protein product [Linum tenue]